LVFNPLDNLNCFIKPRKGSSAFSLVKSKTLSNFPLTETIVSEAGFVKAISCGLSLSFGT
jgi:hypothetical protein